MPCDKEKEKEGQARRATRLMHSRCTEVRLFGNGLTERLSDARTDKRYCSLKRLLNGLAPEQSND
jgi:hypothetical protein